MTLSPGHLARLQHLARAARKAGDHLQMTDRGVFDEAFTPARAASLDDNKALAERVDAFVGRFARQQNLLGDKLLPALLDTLGETPRTVVDNLDRAERLGWVASADEWMRVRTLRNQMVHEYIEDPAILASALQAGHDRVPMLVTASADWLAEIEKRGWLVDGTAENPHA